jgi:hypothetical protein
MNANAIHLSLNYLCESVSICGKVFCLLCAALNFLRVSVVPYLYLPKKQP